MTDELEKARGLLASGDIPGLLRYLRADGDALPLGDVAGLVAEAARLAEFDDLAQAAAMATDGGVSSGMPEAAALWAFGYACLERGIGYLAIRPLARALELIPDASPVLGELITALEQDGQHARAVTVLEEHEAAMEWQHRFQYVYNALMAGDLDKAAGGFAQPPEPEDASWRPAREKVRYMLARAGTVQGVTPLDRWDLRGWHYVLTGGILTALSPYGFDTAMTGRWGWVNDSARLCATALQRLRLILHAAGTFPESIAVLPDRSSQIIGLAAAAVLGLPVTDFDPGRPAANCLVVAYNLNDSDPCAVVAALRDRAPGQVLFERATCWTDPLRVAPTSPGCLVRWPFRRGRDRCASLRTAPSARDRATTARPRSSPPRSRARRLYRTRATAALLRTPTTPCAASSKRWQSAAHAKVVGAGASGSTSLTPDRFPAPDSSRTRFIVAHSHLSGICRTLRSAAECVDRDAGGAGIAKGSFTA